MVFFEAHVRPLVEAPHRPQTDAQATLLQLRADLLKCQIGLGLYQLQQPIGMAFKQRAPMTPYGVWRDALVSPPTLHPLDR